MDSKHKVVGDNGVYYCRGCMSLRIKSMFNGTENIDYCDDCGSTEIAVVDFDKYAAICKKKGKKLVGK